MKTVGIFGDSHADCSYLQEWKTMSSNVGPGWPELLAEKYQVTNFALGGSGVYYSYNLFKKMQDNFDVVIYIPTQASRFSVFYPDMNKSIQIVPHFALLQEARGEYKKLFANDYKVAQAAVAYISHILDQDKDREMKKLMLQEMKRLRPDTIFLRAFNEDKGRENEVVLVNFIGKEFRHWGTTHELTSEIKPPLLDIRKCHMTEGNNRMVFDKVVSAIESNDTVVRFKDSDFVAPTRPFNNYFVTSEKGTSNV